jgi:hypothetical protein
MVQNPLKIQKKIFSGVYLGTKSPFLRPNNLKKILLAAFGTRDYHRKKQNNTGGTWYQIRGLPV